MSFHGARFISTGVDVLSLLTTVTDRQTDGRTFSIRAAHREQGGRLYGERGARALRGLGTKSQKGPGTRPRVRRL